MNGVERDSAWKKNSTNSSCATSDCNYHRSIMKSKKRKSDWDENIQFITETDEDIRVAVQDHDDTQNAVEKVKKRRGRKKKVIRKRVLKEGSNKGGRPRKDDTEDLSRWTISRRAMDLAKEKNFDVRLFKSALKISLEKEQEKADDERRVQDTQEDLSGLQLVNDDGIFQDDSNDINPAPDTEQDVVIHPIDEEREHRSDQTIPRYSRHTPESAANLYLSLNLSKEKYTYLVKNLRSRKCNILPCYNVIRRALQECLPPKTVSTEIEVRSSLQDMLNISGMRLVLMLILHYGWTPEDVRNLILTVTWGFDSSAGHNNPHQRWQDTSLESKSPQTSLLVTSVTILELRSLDTGKTWLNPTPQSTRFCRTLRMAMEKESSDAIRNEFDRVEKEKTFLVPYEFKTKEGSEVTMNFHVEHTLFDGKVVNELVGNSSTLRCPMCFKTNKEYKALGSPCQACDESFLKFGPTLLHAELKMYEQLLKLGYLMKIAHSGKKSQEQKDDVEVTTIEVQLEIHDNFGVRPDQVLQGHGTTNTGNLARRCFADPKKFAECLKVDVELVNKMALSLKLAKCKKPLIIEKYRDLCHSTHNLHFKLYEWATLNPSSHRFLMHSWEVAEVLPLPLAYYAEDAPESWHKFHRKNLTDHARQINRKDRLSDAFNRANFMSDPLISLQDIDLRLDKHEEHPITPEMEEYIK